METPLGSPLVANFTSAEGNGGSNVVVKVLPELCPVATTVKLPAGALSGSTYVSEKFPALSAATAWCCASEPSGYETSTATVLPRLHRIPRDIDGVASDIDCLVSPYIGVRHHRDGEEHDHQRERHQQAQV